MIHRQNGIVFNANVDGQVNELIIEPHCVIDFNDLKRSDSEHVGNINSFVNTIFAKSLKDNNYTQVGKLKKFFGKDLQPINHLKIDAWSGFDLKMSHVTNGMGLFIDGCTKFVRQQTILDYFNEMKNQGFGFAQIAKEFDSSNLDKPRKVVVCSHNNRIY